MIVIRFRVQCQPGKSEEVKAAFEKVIVPSRAVAGVVRFDIAREGERRVRVAHPR